MITIRWKFAEPGTSASERLNGASPTSLLRARSTRRVANAFGSAVAVVLFLASSAALQAQTEEEQAEFFRPRTRWWSVDLDLSTMYDDNINRDPLIEQRDVSFVPRISTRFADRSGPNRLSISYSAGSRTYTASNQPRGILSDFDASWERRFRSSKIVTDSAFFASGSVTSGPGAGYR